MWLHVHVSGPRQQHICICMHLYHTYIYTCVHSTCVCSPTCLQYVIHMYIHTFNTCALKNLRRPATFWGLGCDHVARGSSARHSPLRAQAPPPSNGDAYVVCACAYVFLRSGVQTVASGHQGATLDLSKGLHGRTSPARTSRDHARGQQLGTHAWQDRTLALRRLRERRDRPVLFCVQVRILRCILCMTCWKGGQRAWMSCLFRERERARKERKGTTSIKRECYCSACPCLCSLPRKEKQKKQSGMLIWMCACFC